MMAHDYTFLRPLNGASRAHRAVLAICGGGNAGHALAVAASRTFHGDIVWLASSPEKAELLRRGVFSDEGLQSTGVITGRATNIQRISANPADIIPQADVVMIAVPAYAHAAILREIAPYLKETALIGSLPTRSGFEFEATDLISRFEPYGRRRLFGLQTLPWSTRVKEPGKVVNFGSLKAKVLMATMPSRHAPDVAAWLSHIFGTNIVPTHNFLNMTLGNPGQIIHPGLMYGFFGTWNGRVYREADIPKFYADASDSTGEFVGNLSSEILAVARAVESESANTLDLSGVLSIHEWLRVSYPTQTADTSTVATCFRTGPLQIRKAPMRENGPDEFTPDFSYRYLTEDVPFGLAVSKSIAQMTQIETPCIDRVLVWAQEKFGKEYVVDGRLGGRDTSRLPIPQNYGINSLGELVNWYAHDRSPIGVVGSVGR
jgi:NAD/NADP octopine/nopaline dehydrogenase-like protein/F420-dependent NADP oxidoreductase-like protein